MYISVISSQCYFMTWRPLPKYICMYMYIARAGVATYVPVQYSLLMQQAQDIYTIKV